MARGTAFPLVDKLLEGRLGEELQRRRDAVESYEAIARWLLTEHDINVSAEMVRRWCRDLGITPEPEAAAS